MAEIVGVVGASGALGREIVAALDTAPYRPETLVPLARNNTKVPFVQYGDEDVAVDDVSDEVLERLDLLFVATPRKSAVQLANAAMRAGIPVVDCSGGLHAEGIPMGIPWVNPEVVSRAERRALCVPSPEAILACSVLGPLRRAGIEGQSEATFFVPASRYGRDALEELSAQVIALFNSGSPPRKHFPDGLAFDLLPSAGEAPTGWTESEREVSAEVEAVVGVALTTLRVGVPVFSGISMELRVELDKHTDPVLVKQILSDGGLTVGEDRVRDLPRPRRVEGQPFAHVGRVRIDDQGEVLRIWASMDNLRASAVVAVGLGGLLLA